MACTLTLMIKGELLVMLAIYMPNIGVMYCYVMLCYVLASAETSQLPSIPIICGHLYARHRLLSGKYTCDKLIFNFIYLRHVTEFNSNKVVGSIYVTYTLQLWSTSVCKQIVS